MQTSSRNRKAKWPRFWAASSSKEAWWLVWICAEDLAPSSQQSADGTCEGTEDASVAASQPALSLYTAVMADPTPGFQPRESIQTRRAAAHAPRRQPGCDSACRAHGPLGPALVILLRVRTQRFVVESLSRARLPPRGL